MNKILKYIIGQASPDLTQKVLCFMRICIGLFMVIEGSLKFIGGYEVFKFVGAAMKIFGIHFGHSTWGLMAACAEFFGGLALLLGFATRLATFFLICVMIVAFTMHIHKGDPISVYGFPLVLMVVFISFAIMGGGTYSVDHYLRKKIK